MQSKLLNTKIGDYLLKLRDNSRSDLVAKIDAAIKNELGDLGGGFDVGLFLLSKDLLLFQCKLARALLDFDEKKAALFEKKINEIRDELKSKQGKEQTTTPYKSFLNWVYSVEKFSGFAIDKENDLNYLIQATKQMLKSYEAQRANIENNNVKK
jgi:hypothetical protein